MKSLFLILSMIFPPWVAGAAEPEAEHLAEFEVWLTTKDSGKYLPAENRLRAVLKEEGETGEILAQHILKIGGEARATRMSAYSLLNSRAFTLDDAQNIIPHIDGPYLKSLAVLSVPDDADETHSDYRFAVAYLKLHPEDHEIYWRLRLAATRDAKVSNRPKEDLRLEDDPDLKAVREYVSKNYPRPLRNYSLRDAWDILIELEVLKPGMTVEEAEKILGERYRKEEDPEVKDGWIRWYEDTPRHVNPNLGAEVKDGKIVSFRSGNA